MDSSPTPSESPTPPRSRATAPTGEGQVPKCQKCYKRIGKSNCSQLACFKCCDDTTCEGHREKREERRRQDEILAGTSWVNRTASEKRCLAVKAGAFKEPGFHYLRDTVLVWSVRDFFDNPKWRDDAIRRSRKNQEEFIARTYGSMMAAEGASSQKRSAQEAGRKEGRRKRFRRIMEEMHKKALVEEEKTAQTAALNLEP